MNLTLTREAPVTTDRQLEALKSMDVSMRCPFVYANGKQCCGTIIRGKAFGGTHTRCEEIPPKKYRIWCSDKWDHAGAVSSWDIKERMEFYPDQMPDGMVDALESAGLMETS